MWISSQLLVLALLKWLFYHLILGNFMKQYFLGYGILGICCAFFVAAYFMGPYFFEFFSITDHQKFSSIAPVAIGILAIVVVSIFFDMKKLKFSFLNSGLLLPTAIYLTGAISGSLASWVINGEMDSVYAWFVKPLYWLTLLGVPASLVVGAVYFLIRTKFRRFRIAS